VLAGVGHVGRAFLSLLQEKVETLSSRYGLDLCLRAVLKSDGGFISRSGLGIDRICEIASGPINASPDWNPGLTVEAALGRIPPGVLVECTPSNIKTGEPGLSHIRSALDNGWHVATANKGPLVVDLKRLRERAQKNHLALKFSGAAAAALPALDVGRYSLAGTEIQAIEGILNGTTNYMLTKMGQGVDYAEALRDAQAMGIAEHDPSLDVEGWDTAVKLMLISNVVLGLDISLSDIKVSGITKVSRATLVETKKEGQAVKLLGRIRRDQGDFQAEVAPTAIDRRHALFHVDGAEKGITFLTDTMGAVTVIGGKSDPRGAAAALLKDILNIYTSNL
jgi:homoserine dehydrogenase